MKQLVFLICVALSFTGLSLFELGSAGFTVFHLVIIVFVIYNFIILLPDAKHLSINFLNLREFNFTIAYIVIVNFLLLDSIKVTSFIYSLIILFEFIVLYNFAGKFGLFDIRKLAKSIIFLYFVNVFVTSLLIYTGNLPSSLFKVIFQYYDFDAQIRPYGFSSEPSYAAIIVVFSFFLLLKSYNFSFNKKEAIWYILPVITVFLTKSSYGYLMLIILLVYFLVRSGALLKPRTIFAISALALISIFIVFAMDGLDLENNSSVIRLITIYDYTMAYPEDILGSLYTLSKADGSASFRVVPSIELIYYFQNEGIGKFFFGNGAGSSTEYFTNFYASFTNIELISLGFFPSFVFNYGFVGTCIIFILYRRIFPNEWGVLSLLFFLFLFNADMNTQIFLFISFVIMLSKQLEEMELHKSDIPVIERELYLNKQNQLL